MLKLNSSTVVSGNSPMIRNVSIVIVLFGIFLLCCIWIGLYDKVHSERQLEIDGAFNETAHLARSFEEHTLRTIKGADQTVLFLKYEYEREGRNIDIPFHIKEGRLAGEPFVLLSVIDEFGDLVDSSQVPFVFSNLKDREHFWVHKDFDSGQLFISKPVLGRSSDKWSIQMSHRINKPDGSFGGVAVVSVDPFYFTEFYKQVDLGGNSSIALIGLDGIIRARESGQNADVGRDVSQSPLMDHLAVSATGHYITQSPVDGVKRIYSYRSLKDYPFVVLVGVDEAGVLKAVNERFEGYYLVSGLVTVVIIIFIILLLLATAQQKRAQQGLKQARDGLEVRVEERTQELFATNEELTDKNEELTAMNEEMLHTNQELHHEVVERKRIESILKISEEELIQKNIQLATALQDIEVAQDRLIQQGKLAGIGQLAAGVAHEINNPLGFITGNVEALEQYFAAFSSVLAQYRELGSSMIATDDTQITERVNQVVKFEKEQELEYILADLPDLFRDTNEGLKRMSKIVKGVRLFSRTDREQVFEQYDLNELIKNTLLVADNEIKNYATVEERLGDIPMIETLGGEINQVLLNLIVNGVQAIKEKDSGKMGIIRITTWCDIEFVYCAIEDSGIGVADATMKDIFNPFFTTKPAGQGTGIGLSISYDIIVNRHHGEILVVSNPGQGAKFTIKLPVKQISDRRS